MTKLKFVASEGQYKSKTIPNVDSSSSNKKLPGEPPIMKNAFIGKFKETRGKNW